MGFADKSLGRLLARPHAVCAVNDWRLVYMPKASVISTTDHSHAASRVVVERLRFRGDVRQSRAVRLANGRSLQSNNSWLRRCGLAIWLVALACLGLGAIVWWQLLRALP